MNSTDGSLTVGALILLLLSIPLWIGAVVYTLFLPFARRRIKCAACGKTSKLTQVTEFRLPEAAAVPGGDPVLTRLEPAD